MLNPKAISIVVEGKEWSYMWQDFGQFKRLNVYFDERRIGWKDMPISVDEGDRTITYFIKSLAQGPEKGEAV